MSKDEGAESFETRRVAMPDGVAIEARIYRASPGDGADALAPAICLPGLTRNAADFEELAPRIVAATGRDALAISFRGRGGADRDRDLSRYQPRQYADDVLSLMDALSIDAAILIGTSLGGIVAMLAHEREPTRIRAVVINDVGPAFGDAGLARIGRSISQTSPPARDLSQAALRMRDANEIAFPNETKAFWRRFAQRTHRQTTDGWIADYDPKIAEAFAVVGPGPDLWPAWRALEATPTLLVHGALSDLLTDDIVKDMRAAHPGFAYVKTPGVGHAPFMTEPAAFAAIERFSAAIADDPPTD